MAKTSIVTARLPAEVSADLDRLAEYYERSRAWLVTKAVEQYVRDESTFFAFLQEGEDDISRGDFVTHEQLMEEIRATKPEKNAA